MGVRSSCAALAIIRRSCAADDRVSITRWLSVVRELRQLVAAGRNGQQLLRSERRGAGPQVLDRPQRAAHQQVDAAAANAAMSTSPVTSNTRSTAPPCSSFAVVSRAAQTVHVPPGP